MKVVNVGYQGRKPEDLCDALVAEGVKVLIDVRERAWSYRLPYRKTALKNALEARGIRYLHLKSCGNPYRPPKGQPVDLAQCELEYRKHLSHHPEVVPMLIEHLQESTSALFCYEKHRHECHRGVLLEEVLKVTPSATVVDI